jgi:hypothetical protein
VGNGVISETMTVQNVTVRLNNNGHITGAAANGNLLINYSDYKTDSLNWTSYCQETAVTTNSYNVNITGAEPSIQDYVFVYSRGADGHYTRASGRAFGLTTLGIGSNYITGNTETPGTSVDITLTRGGTQIAATTTSSGIWAIFSTNLTEAVAVGDVVDIQTSDGDSANFTIPAITAVSNGSNNAVQGTAPANKMVYAAQTRYYNEGNYYSVGANTATNGSGSYSLLLDGFYFSKDCTAVDASHPCSRPYVYYYTTVYALYRWGTGPVNISADAYEGDGSFGTAKPYAGGFQHHTFHTDTDQDWTSFIVTAADVGKPIYIETKNYGWGMATTLNLINSDGISLLATDIGFEGDEAAITWTTTAAGTYYVNMVPLGSFYAGYCDAQFDLLISRGILYLPFIRN